MANNKRWMTIDKSEVVIRVLREMQLNYTNQYPLVVPDMDLIYKLFKEQLKDG